MPIAFHDFPEDHFPITLEALHPVTRAVVWTTTIEKPQPGRRELVAIPALSERFGHPVTMRVRWPDGSIQEQEP